MGMEEGGRGAAWWGIMGKEEGRRSLAPRQG